MYYKDTIIISNIQTFLQKIAKIIIIFISYVALVLMNHCLVYDDEPTVAVVSVLACSAFHNAYGVEVSLAYNDASVEEVCDDDGGGVGDDGDDSNVAVGNISHCGCGDILFRPFHIHQMDIG